MINKNELFRKQAFAVHSFPMEGIKFVAFTFILWGFHLSTVKCDCEIVRNVSGKIISNRPFPKYEKCWTIPVPTGHFIDLKINIIESNTDCKEDYVQIYITETGAEYKFCSKDNYTNPIRAFGNVTVIHFVRRTTTISNVIIEYTVKDKPVEGVFEARKRAVSWLIQKRTSDWGWRENTPRAVVALYLASAVSFNGTVLEEELMAKQTELKTAVALLRPSLTNSELSLLIHSLLITCHNPRQFYGYNLVKRLKDQVEESGNFTHPLAYLALCNANESWPLKATSDLINILNSTSKYAFVKDLQAMAVMALSCEAKRSGNKMVNGTLLIFYKNTIKNFKKFQAPDGSFGNVYTTALITQALLSSSQELSKDWNLKPTIKYLIKELNSSSVDFLAIYFALPVLNGKSLMDIVHVNCSANPRKHGDDPTTEISDYVGPKMRVQYSLYIGDEKNVVHTISLRVPENYTAAEIMELAEVEDPKYKYEWKTTSGKMYVYKILSITNDPEVGKFWLLYVGAANSSGLLTHLTNGPDEIILSDGDHLVLWYKTATI